MYPKFAPRAHRGKSALQDSWAREPRFEPAVQNIYYGTRGWGKRRGPAFSGGTSSKFEGPDWRFKTGDGTTGCGVRQEGRHKDSHVSVRWPGINDSRRWCMHDDRRCHSSSWPTDGMTTSRADALAAVLANKEFH